MGYKDPDAERFAAETERRRTRGIVGDWEVVAPTPDQISETVVVDTLKRVAETSIDDEDGREFKLRKKTLSAGLGEIYDPGVIPVKLKREATPPKEHPTTPSTAETQKWSAVQWRRLADTQDVVGAGAGSGEGDNREVTPKGPSVKTEEFAVEIAERMKKSTVEAEDITVKTEPLLSASYEETLSSSATHSTTVSSAEVEEPPLSTVESSFGMFRKRKPRTTGKGEKAQ